MKTTPKYSPRAAVAACALTLQAGATEVQLFPDGEFKATDGRPADVPAWRLGEADAARLLVRAATRATPYIIDYEHQTLLTEKNGQPAPRAATFHRLAWRPGKGLYAVDVAWTKRAQGYLEGGEYGYISPVFSYDPSSGSVIALHHAALTNDPALDGMDAVTAAASRLAAASTFFTDEESTPMNEDLLALLGLAKDAEPKAALAALKARLSELDQLKTQVAELRTVAAKRSDPDPAKYAPVEALKSLQTELAALKAHQTESEVDALVQAGLADGRLVTALEPWARDLGRADPAALRAYLDKAQPIAALRGTQTGGEAPDDAGKDGLTAVQSAVCKRMNMAPKLYKKQLEEAA